MSEDKKSKELNEVKYKDETTKDLVVRLRRIEGQVKGIEKMVCNEANCRNILMQVAAVRSAINKVGGIILENYAKNCFSSDDPALENEKVEELISTFLMFLK